MDGIIVLMMPSIPFGLSFWPYLGGGHKGPPAAKTQPETGSAIAPIRDWLALHCPCFLLTDRYTSACVAERMHKGCRPVRQHPSTCRP